MIGYYDPIEQAGYVTFADEAPSTLLSTVLDSQYAVEIIRLINLRRKSAGILPLMDSHILIKAAQAHNEYMRDNSCFAHQCPREPPPERRVCLAGFRPYGRLCSVGEVIAAGYPSPESVVTAWMNSPGHYAVLMHSKMREIGVDHTVGGYYQRYWTADLGSQPNKLYVFINDDDPVTESRSVTLTMTNELIRNSVGINYARDVMISNDPSFAGADWETYVPQKTWMLTDGKGPKTVYVKYRDPTGNKVLSGDIIFLK